MTKRENFSAIVTILQNQPQTDEIKALIEAMEHEIVLCDNRKSAIRGLTDNQKKNIEIKKALFGVLEANAPKKLNIPEIMALLPVLTSSQKTSALLSQLAPAVVKDYDKKIAVFGIDPDIVPIFGDESLATPVLDSAE